jgi:hypothetical protein
LTQSGVEGITHLTFSGSTKDNQFDLNKFSCLREVQDGHNGNMGLYVIRKPIILVLNGLESGGYEVVSQSSTDGGRGLIFTLHRPA